MSDLTVCQEYLLCTLNEKGKFPALSLYSPACFATACLQDLILSGCIAIDDKKKLQMIGALESEYQHLSPLYDHLQKKKPQTLSDFAAENIDMSGKLMKELMGSVGASLVKMECAETAEGGVFTHHTYYIPKQEVTDRIVRKIRAELLDGDTLSNSTVALVSLLAKDGSMKKYFSDYEKSRLKERLEEIKSTPSGKAAKEMLDAVDEVMAMLVAVNVVVS